MTTEQMFAEFCRRVERIEALLPKKHPFNTCRRRLKLAWSWGHSGGETESFAFFLRHPATPPGADPGRRPQNPVAFVHVKRKFYLDPLAGDPRHWFPPHAVWWKQPDAKEEMPSEQDALLRDCVLVVLIHDLTFPRHKPVYFRPGRDYPGGSWWVETLFESLLALTWIRDPDSPDVNHVKHFIRQSFENVAEACGTRGPLAGRTKLHQAAPDAAHTKGLVEWAGGERVTLAIVFTDIVDSTALRNEIGDERMNKTLEAHFCQGRRLIGEHGGREVKTTGDGFLAVFHETAKALDFAMTLHSDPGTQAIQIRVGIHVGEVTVKDTDQDIDGTVVNFASRVVGAIRGAQIWLSDQAKQNIQSYAPSATGI